MGAGALIAVAMFARRNRKRNSVRNIVAEPEVNSCPSLEYGGMCGKESMKCNGRQGKLSCPIEAKAYEVRQAALAEEL